MKKTIIMVIIAVLVWTISSYMNWFTTEAWYKTLPKEKVEIVERVAKQFKEDKKRNGSCTIDWQPVSLEGMILAKIANESSYGEAGVGARTNNWWNIHGDLIWKATKFITADHSSTYAVFGTPEDGLRNIAQRLKNRWCKLSYQSSWNYVKWPRAEQSAQNKKDVSVYHWRLKEVAQAYDGKGTLVIADTVKSRSEWYSLNRMTNTWKWIKDGCFFVRKIKKADYIQIDQDWEMKTRIDLGQKDWETMDLFNCYE